MVIDFIVKTLQSGTRNNSLENTYVSSPHISHTCVSMSFENSRDFFQAYDLKRNPTWNGLLVHSWALIRFSLESDQRLSATSGNTGLWGISSNMLLRNQVETNNIKEELSPILPLLSSSRNLCMPLVLNKEQIWMTLAHFSTLLLWIIFCDNFSLFPMWNSLCLVLFYNNHS